MVTPVTVAGVGVRVRALPAASVMVALFRATVPTFRVLSMSWWVPLAPMGSVVKVRVVTLVAAPPVSVAVSDPVVRVKGTEAPPALMLTGSL
jgi:hypothetical protein